MREHREVDWDGVGTLILTLVTVTLFAGIPLGIALAWAGWVGLRTGRDAGSDLLVVFGKRLTPLDKTGAGVVDRDYRARLMSAAALAAGRPQHCIIVLGGRTARAGPTEAEAGERLLQGLQRAEHLNILLEQQSADTLTNLRNLRVLLEGLEHGPGRDARRLTLITNRYHLARVGLMAASLGLEFHRCAAEDKAQALRPGKLGDWLREALFINWFITGKLWARLTRNQRMLARVT